MHVRGAERDRDPVLPVHAEDVYRPLPPGEVRQSGPRQQAASQGDTFSRSEWFVPNFDPGSVEKEIQVIPFSLQFISRRDSLFRLLQRSLLFLFSSLYILAPL